MSGRVRGSSGLEAMYRWTHGPLRVDCGPSGLRLRDP